MRELWRFVFSLIGRHVISSNFTRFYRNLLSPSSAYTKSAHDKRNLCLTFIGPCIIEIVDEWKTNLMSLTILFHLLCAQHVSDINISIFGSLRLCWWITTSVVLFSVRCVLELLVDILMSETCWAHNKWNKIVTSSWFFIRQLGICVIYQACNDTILARNLIT